MPALSIPKSDRAGLSILREMPDDVFNDLVNEIQRSPASIPTLRNVSSEDSEQVLNAINSLHRVRAYNQVSPEDFSIDVGEALRERNELRPNEEPKLRERLTRVLNIEALNIAAKAITLHLEHERVFCSARIITDARPVYGKDTKSEPAAMIITHSLKISYHQAGDSGVKEFYVGLGSEDVEELIRVLERAKSKAQSLRSTFDESKVRFIDPQGE